MQLPNAPTGDKFPLIIAAIQEERVLRYSMPAGRNLERAFQLYVWNGSLCESFHIALHYAEIVTRNSFNRALVNRFGETWFADQTLATVLDERFRDQLAAVISDETKAHGAKLTAHHITSSLTFGFWGHLATKRFDRMLWAKGVRNVFPTAPKDIDRQKVHDLIESVRRWRNRIAHHRAIFDKGPMHKHADALDLIGWSCADTRGWVASASRVPAMLEAKPK